MKGGATVPSFEKNKSSGLWSCRFREADENGINHNKRPAGIVATVMIIVAAGRKNSFAVTQKIVVNVNVVLI